ncbi:hypothetical protein SM11_chr0231 [Sinorhizobium meliloti SM11]|uniref:Uncharacterized protein n=1 Tax=Sinorhizobium meliloti (strain SM11) TaxID=707241 RepID=F7X7S4_SINMM|nr:hypothetical protein [Sinorhizobium meliloti]AEH77514.1 hypothetical protein SM11_chr0231 [Sinorhizobium meliloti SM11]MDE4559605.1 hypothetical protein [Sinorhizobium meliloti SM11]
MTIVRLRPPPAIADKPDEGLRLRRQSAETGREQVQGADDSRPHRPWSQDAYDLQMQAKVAVTLVGELFSNLHSLEEILEFKLLEQSGIEELAFQIHQIQKATERLQPA